MTSVGQLLENCSVGESQAVATLSHELRTPLNAILGNLQLLARDSSLTDQSRKRVQLMERAGQHLLALVTQCLEVASAQTGEIQLHLEASRSDLLIEEIVSLFEREATAKGLELSYRLASDTPSNVLTDIGKVRQILINLVGNAIKFTQRGGVHILVRARDLADDSCTMEIDVMDTGPGMDSEEVTNLFQRFKRGTARKTTEGVGLGLAISKHHARLLGGKLSVESKVAQGSVFRLSLPVTWLHYEDLSPELECPTSSARDDRGLPSDSGTFQVQDPVVGESVSETLAASLCASARAADPAALREQADALEDPIVADKIRQLTEAYDYEGIIRFLSNVTHAVGD